MVLFDQFVPKGFPLRFVYLVKPDGLRIIADFAG
jgi:hypothetical protein